MQDSEIQKRRASAMTSFTFELLPGRVVFGVNAVEHLSREVDQLGARRALVLSTPQQESLARDVATWLGARSAGVYPYAAMHVPVEVAERAIGEAARLSVD